MSENAEAGHGATIALELGSAPNYTPVGGSFTAIGEVSGDFQWPSLMVPEFEVTSHNDSIDFWKAGVLSRGPITFTVFYGKDDASHEAMVQIVAIQPQPERGIRLRGPSGSSGDDEWIGSGFIQNVGPISHPVKEGPRTAEVTIRLSGPMILDGNEYP
jgi:hypothetical protein